MKLNRLFGLIAAVILLGAARLALAEDPLKAAPDMYRLVYENDRVRVLEVTFQPGQKIAEHSHPDHYVYVLEGGTLAIAHNGGNPVDAIVKVGDVIWIPAETHWAVNSGTTKVRLLVNELKEPARRKAGTAPKTKK